MNKNHCTKRALVYPYTEEEVPHQWVPTKVKEKVVLETCFYCGYSRKVKKKK